MSFNSWWWNQEIQTWLFSFTSSSLSFEEASTASEWGLLEACRPSLLLSLCHSRIKALYLYTSPMWSRGVMSVSKFNKQTFVVTKRPVVIHHKQTCGFFLGLGFVNDWPAAGKDLTTQELGSTSAPLTSSTELLETSSSTFSLVWLDRFFFKQTTDLSTRKLPFLFL